MEKWIEELIKRRRTFKSPLIIVISKDAVRISQLLEQKTMDILAAKRRKENYYYFDGITLVERVDIQKSTPIMVKHPLKAPRLTEVSPFRLLGAFFTIKEIIEKHEHEQTIFVISGIAEATPEINNALYSLTIDQKLLDLNATIIVFVPEKTTLSKIVMEKAIVMQLPLSTIEERIKIITASLDALPPKIFCIKKKITRDIFIYNVASCLKGYTLDEVDEILARCAVDYGKLTVENIQKTIKL